MTQQVAEQPSAGPQALAEPTQHVRKGWIGTLCLASLVMWMAVLTPANFLLPAQLQNIDPKHKVYALGLISAFAAIAAVVVTPIAGALSDRTTNAYSIGHLRGRRHRWTLAMALLGGVCLAMMGVQKSVLTVGVLWVLFNNFCFSTIRTDR